MLKAYVAERGLTDRAKVTDQNFTDSNAVVKVVGIIALFFSVAAIASASCNASDNRKAVEIERVHAEHPATVTSK